MRVLPSWKPTEVQPLLPSYLIALYSPWCWGIGLSLAAYLGTVNYLLFHTAVESFTIFVSFSIAVIVLNTHHLIENSFITFLGISFGFLGIFDFIHTVTYQGMDIIPNINADLPTQMWIISRFVLGFSFLLAHRYFNKRSNPAAILFAYSGVTLLIFASVFFWDNFPRCWIEGQGLTPFKLVSEYLLMLIFLTALILLIRNREQIHPRIYRLLIYAYIATIATELPFTLYTHPYGPANLVGHLFKLISAIFFYRAFIETSMTEPYNLLFYQLRQTNDQLTQANEELQAQSEELSDLNYRLADEIDIRITAEQSINSAYAELQLVFNTAGEGLCVINSDQRIVRINNTLLRYIGKTSSEVIGQNCADVFRNDLCNTAMCPFNQFESGLEHYENDLEMTDSDGKLRSYIISAEAIRNSEGAIELIVESFKDITERKGNERALQRDFELAATIQRASLPARLRTSCFSLETIYHPYHHVSGDVYDYIWNEEHQVLLGCIIDVMGHGLHTAMQTSALKVLFRQIAGEEWPIHQKMAWINQVGSAYFAEDSFAAAICFELDFRKGIMHYCAAGINCFLHISGSEAKKIKAPGLMLGITTQTSYEIYSLTFAPGDTLLFLSDGILDVLQDKWDTDDCHEAESVIAVLKKLADQARDDATAIAIFVSNDESLDDQKVN